MPASLRLKLQTLNLEDSMASGGGGLCDCGGLTRSLPLKSCGRKAAQHHNSARRPSTHSGRWCHSLIALIIVVAIISAIRVIAVIVVITALPGRILLLIIAIKESKGGCLQTPKYPQTMALNPPKSRAYSTVYSKIMSSGFWEVYLEPKIVHWEGL